MSEHELGALPRTAALYWIRRKDNGDMALAAFKPSQKMALFLYKQSRTIDLREWDLSIRFCSLERLYARNLMATVARSSS